MGFSFRGKSKNDDGVDNTEVHAVASGYDGSNENISHADVKLKRVKEQHKWDPFMDVAKIDAVDDAIRSGDVEKEAAIEDSLLLEDSPYMEVRSSVRVET